MEDFKSYNEEFISTDVYKYNPEAVNNLVKRIDKCFHKDNDNFAELCYLFFELKQKIDYNLDKDFNYYGRVVSKSLEFVYFLDIVKSFGFEQRTVEKMIKVYEKFIVLEKSGDVAAKSKVLTDDVVAKVKNSYSGFSRSKLFELLSVSDSQLVKDLESGKLKFSMTVVEIRAYIKDLKGSATKNKVFEDSSGANDKPDIEAYIPMVYDPSKIYEFSYFEKQSKSQLLNIVWELQNYIKKINKK